MGFTFSQVADWWDAQDKETEKILDNWVMDSSSDGEIALKVIPQAAYKLASFVGSGFVDALRLGEGVAEFQATGSKWALFQDGTRLLVFAGPLAKAAAPVLAPLGKALGNARQAIRGVQAASKVVVPVGAKGPCAFVAVQNALSFVSGRTIQMFSSLGDIMKLTGGVNKGIAIEKLLASCPVIRMLKQLGVIVKPLGCANTIEEVAAAARNARGPVLFSIKWIKKITSKTPNIHQIEEGRHAFMAYKDWLGRIRYMDYANGPVGRAFASIEEAARRGGNWANVGNFEILSNAQMFSLEGAGLTVVETFNSEAHLAIAVQLAAHWLGRDKSPESMMDSVQDFAAKRGVDIPLISRTAVGPGGGAIHLTKPKHAAPRPDWLTGVQFRLNDCGFPCGKVDGIHGPKTRLAVRAFQKKYCTMIDAIPGQETQRRLVDVCGY
jgi:hypothetical protein